MTYDRYRSFEGVPTVGRITPVTNKDAIIPGDLWDPHYTDRRFIDGTTDGLTIFVDPGVNLVPGGIIDQIGEGLDYMYSDRVMQSVGYDTVHAAGERAAQDIGNNRSARYIEHMLQYALEDESLWLGHMRAGVNRGNGYSYHVYGVRSGEQT